LLCRTENHFPQFVHSVTLDLASPYFLRKKTNARSNGFAGFSNSWRRIRLTCLYPTRSFRQLTTRGGGCEKLVFLLSEYAMGDGCLIATRGSWMNLYLAEPLINFRLTFVYRSIWSRMFWKDIRREFWSGGFPAGFRYQKMWLKNPIGG